MRSNFTPAEDRRLEVLWNDPRLKTADIAELMGRPRNSIRNRVRRLNLEERPKGRPRIHDWQAIGALLDQGLKPGEVAKRFGVQHSIVYYIRDQTCL